MRTYSTTHRKADPETSVFLRSTQASLSRYRVATLSVASRTTSYGPMIFNALADVRHSVIGMHSTSPFRSFIAAAAEIALALPVLAP